MKTNRITINKIQEMKVRGEPIPMVTAYDYTSAKIINSTNIPIILIGDSMGNNILGYDSTIPVTVEDIIRSTKSVTAGAKKPLIVSDLPFFSYQIDIKSTLLNVCRLIQDGGANAVKLEGGQQVADTVKKIVNAGIPVMGHIGLTPQSVNQLGGYKLQGKTSESAKILLNDALALQESGAFAIVLELIPSELSREITDSLKIPTIGIGAGVHCDGQVQVFHDLLGLDLEFSPKHSRKYANLASTIKTALENYDRDVRKKEFPKKENSFFIK